MRYVGGKTRQARDFAPALLADTVRRGRYFEPFVGGGSMLGALGPHFSQVRAGDTHPDLVAMWQEVLGGWDPPSEVGPELYAQMRHAPVSALRGFVGFGCSFGGKWFGGYHKPDKRWPRNIAAVTRDNLLKITAGLPGDTLVTLGDYSQFEPGRSDVVYADPPYRGGQHFTGTEPFDHDRFWATMDRWWRRGADVYVSEFQAPPGWEPLVVSKQRYQLQGPSDRFQEDTLFRRLR
ncbi:DNA methylase [Microbacterium phage Sucha]|nr:DNA methylase [Microbacterium phage Sucha]